jgi:hypothetical protein
MSRFNNTSIERVLENIFLPDVVKTITSNDTPVILITHHLPVPVGRKNQLSEEMVEIKVFSNDTQMRTYLEIVQKGGINEGKSIQQGIHYIKHHFLFDESPQVVHEWFSLNSQRILDREVRIEYRVEG